MFYFEKRTQFPVKINNKNPKLAAFVMSQYGGPYSRRIQFSGILKDGEIFYLYCHILFIEKDFRDN